jgi:hypothetical protein
MSKRLDNQQDKTTIVTSEQFNDFVEMLRSFGEIFTIEDNVHHE